MTFENIEGVFIIMDGDKLIGSTSSHVVEKTGNHLRLTFGAINVEFEDCDIDFYDLIKLLPK